MLNPVREVLWRRRALREVPPIMRSRGMLVPLDVVGKRTLKLFRRWDDPTPIDERVEHEVRTVRVDDPAAPPLDLHLYRPRGERRRAGAVLFVNGGGFVTGDAATGHHLASTLAAELEALVVSVDYRRAPEHPFPAAIDDCRAALAWLVDQGAELGVDPTSVVLHGGSAGGGLAACTAQAWRDAGDPPLAGQVLLYPMLDDRTGSRGDRTKDALVWTRRSSRFGWRSYLGGADPTTPYASAARREDLSGLPPTWIGVGDIDLYHDESVRYAERLRAADVECELVVAPGMLHGSHEVTELPSIAALEASRLDALSRFVGPVAEAR